MEDTVVKTYTIDGETLTLEEAVHKYMVEVHVVLRQINSTKGATHLDRDDLLQEGCMALLNCFDRYDESSGNKFSTYARHRIKGRMKDVIRAGQFVSRSVSDENREIIAAEEQLRAKLKRQPTADEIASSLGKTPERIAHIRTRSLQGDLVSFDDPSFGNDSTSGALGYSDGSYDEALVQVDDRALIEAEIDKLTDDMERAVMVLFYFDRKQLKDIAKDMGCSESRISQIRSKAESKIRASLAPMQDDLRGY